MTPPPSDRIIAFPGTESGPALQLRIDLLLATEPFWRRLLVPAGCDIWDLHVALQDALGWLPGAAHRFVLDSRDGARLTYGVGGSGRRETGRGVAAGPALRAAGGPALYVLHGEPDLEFELALEGETADAPGPLPRCLDGAGAATGAAEGVGFVPGYVVFSDPRLAWRRYCGHE